MIRNGVDRELREAPRRMCREQGEPHHDPAAPQRETDHGPARCPPAAVRAALAALTTQLSRRRSAAGPCASSAWTSTRSASRRPSSTGRASTGSRSRSSTTSPSRRRWASVSAATATGPPRRRPSTSAVTKRPWTSRRIRVRQHGPCEQRLRVRRTCLDRYAIVVSIGASSLLGQPYPSCLTRSRPKLGRYTSSASHTFAVGDRETSRSLDTNSPGAISSRPRVLCPRMQLVGGGSRRSASPAACSSAAATVSPVVARRTQERTTPQSAARREPVPSWCYRCSRAASLRIVAGGLLLRLHPLLPTCDVLFSSLPRRT